MPLKIKTSIDFSNVKKKLIRYQSESIKAVQREIGPLILNDIKNGRSPVQGFVRFQKYSESYLSSIKSGRYAFLDKKKRPVNLTLSGVLLESLKIDSTDKQIEISFTDELFNIHNSKGAGKSKVIRRMLPTNEGEFFNKSITLRIREILSEVKNKIFG